MRLQPFLRSSADNFDWAGRPHIQTRDDHRPVRRRRARATRRAAARSSRAGRRRACGRARRARRRFSARLARRAYRQPVGAAELAPILEFYDAGRARGHASRRASSAALQRILASPRFVFRVERDPAGAAPGSRPSPSATSSWRRGCRSSCGAAFPTSALLRAAAQGTLHAAGGARAAGARACWPIRGPSALVANFAGQWLQLRNVRSVQPNSDEFPDFDDNLRAGVPARDRAALREHRARGPQRARPAARRLHVRERAAGAALRHPQRLRQPLPPRAGDRRRAPRPARARAASWR